MIRFEEKVDINWLSDDEYSEWVYEEDHEAVYEDAFRNFYEACERIRNGEEEDKEE